MLRNVGMEDYCFSHGGAHMYGWENDYRAYPELGVAIVTAANEWPMLKTRYWGHSLVCDFVVSWMQNEARSDFRRPDKSWAWKVSWVVGANMVGSLIALGDGQPTQAMVEAMASGPQIVPGYEQLWDEAGFRAGAQDVLAQVSTTQDWIEFSSSTRHPVSPVERELIVRELGAPPTVPLPRPD
jgi:hypothetical protein